MLIIDAHLDLGWNALQWNRDLLRSVYTIRNGERTTRIAVPGLGLGTVALPEMRQGRIALSFVTLLARSTGTPSPHADYPSPLQAYASARGQLAYYRALESQGHARIITTTQQLDQHMTEWQRWEGNGAAMDTVPPLGFIISMESADPILAAEELYEWYEAGVRLLGPAHYGSGRYAGGNDTELGLTAAGPALLAEMEGLGISLDVTHLSDQAFWQALDCYGGPILASHNNCRALVPSQRQLSDKQLKAIFQRDGVVGVAFIALMLQLGWILGQSSNRDITLDTVIDHIDHLCQLAGNSRHVALGTDLDGGAGRDVVPSDMDTIADLQQMPDRLTRRGYRQEDIEAILHGNWLAWLRQAWSGQAK